MAAGEDDLAIGTHMAESSVAGARARLRESKELRDAGRHREAIDCCDETVELFVEEDDSQLRAYVTEALLLKGGCLEKLGRHADAVAVFDDLVARYHDQAEPDTHDLVARAFISKAFVLEDLGRLEDSIAVYDDLVAQSGGAQDSRIRMRVGWGLWNKTRVLRKLGRPQECEPIYEELAARHDEGADPELDKNIVWCIRHRAWRLAQVGDSRGQIAAYDEVAERFGNAADPELRKAVIESLRQKGDVLAGLGRPRESIQAYDAALVALGDTTDPRLRDAAVGVLLNKGIALGELDRLDEGVVMYDSAVATYLAAMSRGGGTDGVAWRVVLALLYKVQWLCKLGRSAEAANTHDQLTAVLHDDSDRTSAGAAAEPRPVEEHALAAGFADVVNRSECWRWFESGCEEPPRSLMAEQAVDLYRLTEPWVAGDGRDSNLAPQAAASILRDVADGYAMLTRRWSPEARRALPLPKLAEGQRRALIRRFGVDDWAADLGHPVILPQPAEHAEESDAEPAGQWDSDPFRSAPRFLDFLLTMAYSYELLEILWDSPSGRDILTNENFRLLAAQHISTARKWIRWFGPDSDAASGAGAILLIAQAFFLATYRGTPSNTALFPGSMALGDLFREHRTYDWLLGQDVRLPHWITQER
jgi:tetratricopeptide (TPR) repeat protein